jgi:hypothetical protein
VGCFALKLKSFSYRQWIGIIILCRLLLSIALPLTGDEAYYILWGKYPALSYYDHPPMIGWIHGILAFVTGQNVLAARVLAIVMTTMSGVILYQILKPAGKESAKLISLAYLVSPFSFFFVLSCPDTAVLLAAMFAVYFMQLASIQRSNFFAFMAGVGLGLAALSKFIAIIVVPGFIIMTFMMVPWRSAFRLLLIAAVPAMLGAYLCLWTSYTNCWSNVRFNFGRFDMDDPLNARSLLLYGASLGFLLYPILVAKSIRYLRQGGRGVRRLWGSEKVGYQYIFPVLAVFIAASIGFIPVASRDVVGLHWFLAIYPFSFIFLLNEKKGYINTAIGAGVLANLALMALLAYGLSQPNYRFNKWRYYPDLIVAKYPLEVCKVLEDFVGANKFVGSTREYSQSSILEIACGRQFLTLEVGAKYGRSFDEFHDFRALEGELVVFLSPDPIDLKRLPIVLDHYRVGSRELYGQDFHMIAGRFSYSGYRDLILKTAHGRYYTRPLPFGLPKEQCFMQHRYQIQ